MFFAFPLNDKPDWRKPPLITLLLILINLVIYFGPQRLEQIAQEKAAQFYVASELPEIELPLFVEHLRQTSETRSRNIPIAQAEQALREKRYRWLLAYMESEPRFVAELRNGRIVASAHRDYARWKDLRRQYENLRGESFTERWASRPADWSPVALLTACFLHASLMHLIGNMVFLFVFGYTVERTLGARRYLALYLLAGIGGELGDLAARWGSAVIGLGASGAISGLMAAYAVLYGRQRIRFFYQLLFYFDYVRAPAILLLPVWIGHEFLQQWLDPHGSVAYMAHAGGLIVGALGTWWLRRRDPARTCVPVAPVAASDPAPELLAKAQKALKSLKIDDALRYYCKLVRLQPQNGEFVSTYFNLAKRLPDSEHFHRAARYVFRLEGEAAGPVIFDNYRIYVQTAKPPQLPPDLLQRVALRFARDDRLQEAERATRLLLRVAPEHSGLPTLLLALVQSALKKRQHDKALEFRHILGERHGQESETRLAADLLRAAGVVAGA